MNLRIKEICRDKGIMLKDLAGMIGITEVGLSKSLNGNPNISRLEEIAAALGVPVTELFDKPKEGVIHCPHCGKEIKLNPGV